MMTNKEKTLQFYNEKAKAFISGTIDVVFNETQNIFLEYIPTGGKILDFGCGSGRDTKYFLEKGYVVDAVDGSKELCKKASEYVSMPVKQMLFEELIANQEYDGIWAEYPC